MSRGQFLLNRQLAAMWEQVETLDLLRGLNPTPTSEAFEDQRKRCLQELRKAKSILKDAEEQIKLLQLPVN
jgi:hypothetical protein